LEDVVDLEEVVFFAVEAVRFLAVAVFSLVVPAVELCRAFATGTRAHSSSGAKTAPNQARRISIQPLRIRTNLQATTEKETPNWMLAL
jgi:hypothetical protein